MAKQIKHTASDRFMTLDELGAFVTDALRAGAAGSEIVGAQITMGGKLKNLTVEVPNATTADLQK